MTTTYTIDRDTIISAALRKLQSLALGVTPDSTTISNAAQSFNLVLKYWSTKGIKLWTIDEYAITLTASKRTYTIGPSGSDITNDKPIKLIMAWMNNTSVTPNQRQPVEIVSRKEYNLLGTPDQTGMISTIMYDANTTYGTIYTYLTPDSTTATNYQLVIQYQRYIDDISASTDIPNVPSEWELALIWGLADEMAIDYGVKKEVRDDIAMKAKELREDLEGWDTEYVSTTFTPDQRMK